MITFCHYNRPLSAHGGRPPAVVYFECIENDQLVQAVLEPTGNLSKDRGATQFVRGLGAGITGPRDK